MFAIPYSLENNRYALPPNLRVVRLRLEQGAFLAGIIAGRMTRNDKVGMISDMSEQDVEILMYAFIQGIRQVNPDSQIFITRTNSTESMLENETTKMVATDGADIIFAMSQNYNDTIIRSAYYFGHDVFLINSWYNADLAWPKHVITSLEISFDPVIEFFINRPDAAEQSNPLPKMLLYDLSNPEVMHFSWDNQEETIFEAKHAKHSSQHDELSRKTRKELRIWTQRIRTQKFTVFNIMENNTAFDIPKNVHYRDSSEYSQDDEE